MDNNVYFLHQCKHTNGAWDKGIVVKDSDATAKENYEAALQSYHAYLGAYAYGHDQNTDYVACYIVDMEGNRPLWETWRKDVVNPEEPELEE